MNGSQFSFQPMIESMREGAKRIVENNKVLNIDALANPDAELPPHVNAAIRGEGHELLRAIFEMQGALCAYHAELARMANAVWARIPIDPSSKG